MSGIRCGVGAAFLAIIGLCFLGSSAQAQDLSSEMFSAMKARSIGPAGMSGRITTIAAVASDPNVVFVGAATGGVWKTTNGGQTWKPLFDDQRVSGIGAIAVHPTNPDLVWVGTGEGNPRNSAGVGVGVYKSVDGGDTWVFLGLEETERIHRILLHPTDTDVAWVGAMGPAWSDGESRGVYRTEDGGASWENVLFVDQGTGVSDMVLDPENADHLLVGMWSFRRQPWSFISGGAGSGLYSTFDGGDTWARQGPAEGLPGGELGRIGLTISASAPNVAYALIEAQTSVLLRSQDGGKSWSRMSSGPQINPRPFYYTDIQVDPTNELRLFNLHSRLQVSENGGESFRTIGRGVHSDFQTIWIDPNDAMTIWIGTDGGVYLSRDRGETWRFVDNLPVGQFYHVSVDMERPYNIYGGMQDNGSWRGPSTVWENGGIRNFHWAEVGFGDGFATLMDPSSPYLGYSMSQGGGLRRFDLRTGERKEIRPWAPDSVALRFSWNAAIAIDPHNQGALYYGSQFVHKSLNRGDSWQIISGDLTTNDPDKQNVEGNGGITPESTGAETHTTILTIAPSVRDPEVVWVGTDDGRVHLTQSGGGQWTDVTDRIKRVPEGTWIPHVEASHHDPAVAYVVFDDHRRGNWTPYLYRTTDFGRNWKNIADEDVIDGFVHTVEEDPLDPNLLYMGTEFGLYISTNAGEDWFKWTEGLPTVPVRSLVVHPRDHDLVIGTHGRALYVLDDIRPLRELASISTAPVHLFQPPEAVLSTIAAVNGYHFSADAVFKGKSRPRGAMISYWIGSPEPDSGNTSQGALIEISDSDGDVVRRWNSASGEGLHRVTWDLREDAIEVDGGPIGGGVEVLPGTYTVRITANGTEVTAPLAVLPDPRNQVAMEDRVSKQEARRESQLATGILQSIESRLEAAEETLGAVRGRMVQESGDTQRLQDALDRADGAKEASEEALKDIRPLRRIVSSLSSSRDKPTEAQRINLARFLKAVDGLADRVDVLLAGPMSDVRSIAGDTGIDLAPRLDPVARPQR